MPRMTSKSTISNSTRSVKVTFREIVIGQFSYTCLAISVSPTRVDIEKGSERVSVLTSNLIFIKRVIEVRVAPGFFYCVYHM